MSKGHYTVTTKGSVTTVHWEGPPGKSIGRCTNSGPMGFPPDPSPRPTDTASDKPKKRKKKGR